MTGDERPVDSSEGEGLLGFFVFPEAEMEEQYNALRGCAWALLLAVPLWLVLLGAALLLVRRVVG